jgi:signal peptidase
LAGLVPAAVKNAGSAMKYMQTPTGFAITIVLPVFILLIVQGSILVKNIMGISKEKLKLKTNTFRKFID